MSAMNITNVAVLDNPTTFLNPFQFEISYECLVPLDDDLEWKLIYVGSAEDEKWQSVGLPFRSFRSREIIDRIP